MFDFFDVFESWNWLAIGIATVGVGAWVTIRLWFDREESRERRGRHRSRRRHSDWADFPRRDLGAVVAALPASERQQFGQDVARLLDKHESRRFTGFVAVRRGEVSEMTFALLYAIATGRHQVPADVRDFRMAQDDVRRLVKASS